MKEIENGSDFPLSASDASTRFLSFMLRTKRLPNNFRGEQICAGFGMERALLLGNFGELVILRQDSPGMKDRFGIRS